MSALGSWFIVLAYIRVTLKTLSLLVFVGVSLGDCVVVMGG